MKKKYSVELEVITSADISLVACRIKDILDKCLKLEEIDISARIEAIRDQGKY